jgi:hypothetical protein
MAPKRGAVAVAVVAVGALLSACTAGPDAHVATDAGRVPSSAATPVPTSTPSTPAVEAFTPARILAPTVGIDAAIVGVGVLPDGLLDVPPDPKVIGWWRDGARPGDAAGGVVLDGHVDSAALGVGWFARLRELAVGDAVEVRGEGGGSRRYVVDARREYPKAALPAAEVFAQTGAERLVLITCGGAFDAATRHYADNIVVYATPA